MKYHIFDENKVQCDVVSIPTKDGQVRITLSHSTTGLRMEALSKPDEVEILEVIRLLKSDMVQVLKCFFVDFLGAEHKVKLLRLVRTANQGSFQDPLYYHRQAEGLAKRLGAALVSAYFPLEDEPITPEWNRWEGGERPLPRDQVIAVVTQDQRIVTVAAGSIAWKHHENDPWNIAAYSTDETVIQVARNYEDEHYGT